MLPVRARHTNAEAGVYIDDKTFCCTWLLTSAYMFPVRLCSWVYQGSLDLHHITTEIFCFLSFSEFFHLLVICGRQKLLNLTSGQAQSST